MNISLEIEIITSSRIKEIWIHYLANEEDKAVAAIQANSKLETRIKTKGGMEICTTFDSF